MFKKILIGIIVFGIIATLLLQIDDDLNPEIAAFLKQAEPAESSEAYLYFLGIVAAEGEEPLAVGKQLFASMQQAEKQYSFDDDTFGYQDYPYDKKLALPQGEFFCSSSEDGCWQAIFSKENDLELVLQTYSTLLVRYQTFLQLDDYHTLAKPILMEAFPPFDYTMKANRLVVLNAIHIAQTSDPEEAIKELTKHIAELRQYLKSADNIVGKIIYNHQIAESLDVLSIISHQNHTVLKETIPPLSLAEHDLRLAMSREFAMGYDFYASLDRNPEIFAMAGEGSSGNLPGWLVRTGYKPNISINERYEVFKEVILRSQAKQTEFVPILEMEKGPMFRWSNIRNPVGAILNNVASPDFDEYIARLFDLNAKISLFNQTANKVELPLDLDYIENPYYDEKGTAHYSDDGKSICLTGPLNDDKNQRCLRVKL